VSTKRNATTRLGRLAAAAGMAITLGFAPAAFADETVALKNALYGAGYEITNVSPQECNPQEILGIYKNQMVVEMDFRLLKEPCIASVIYLKTPGRVQSLAMLLHVALLVRAMIQYKLRKGIEEYPAEKLPRVGRGGRKLQKNITTRFFIEEMRHQGFIEDDVGAYKLIFINPFHHLQTTTFLELMGLTVEELIE